MVSVRSWLLVVLTSSSVVAACGGRSTFEQAGPEPGTTGGSGGSAAAGRGGRGGAAGNGTGGSAASGTGGTGGGSSGASGTAGTAGAPATCQAATICGGDPSGRWTVESSCLTVGGLFDFGVLGLGCDTAPISGSLVVTGSWNVDAKTGTISDYTTTTGQETFSLAPGCLHILDTSVACDQLGQVFVVLGYADVVCTDTSTGCACLATVDHTGAIASERGPATPSYTTDAGVLTVTDELGDDVYTYCVSGDRLTLSPVGNVTGSVVLQADAPR